MAEGGGEGQAIGARSATSDVFISYAAPDATIAMAIVKALEKAELHCWIAPRDVNPGASYATEIVHAIDAALAMVLVLTPDAAASPHVVREVERATSKRCPIITLRIDETSLPEDFEYFLNSSHWMDASRANVAGAMPALVTATQRVLSGSAAIPMARTTPSAPTPHSGRRISRAVVFGVVATALAAIGLGIYWKFVVPSRNRVTIDAPAVVDRSIAVIPFEDISDRQDQKYFARGVSEEILEKLSKIPGLKVIGRTSSFQYAGTQNDPRSLGKALGAGQILTGTVRRDANHVRVTAQLLRTADGSQLWTESFEREIVDLLDAQDDLAGGLARTMQISVDSESLHAGRPTIPEAYDLYLKGLHAADQISQASTGEAIAAFQQALNLDPKFAAAATELARAYSWMGQQAWILPKEAFAKARQAAEAAIRLDPKLAAPHVVMASIHRVFDWDWDAADRELATAFALAPQEPAGLGEAACLASAKGDFSKARLLVRQALVLDPLNPDLWSTLGNVVELGAGNFPAAEAAMRASVRIAPKGGTLHYWLGVSILMQHRYPDALTAFQQETMDDGQLEGMAMVYHALGKKSESDEATTAAAKQDAVVWSSAVARVYAFRGESDRAFTWLQRAYDQRDEDLWMIKGDPVFARMSNDQQFTQQSRI